MLSCALGASANSAAASSDTASAEFHHRLEAYLGGEATLANCVVLCRHCHSLATKERRPEIDKTRRISDKRMGIRRKSTMPGSRSSKYKRLMNGETVLR